MKRALFSLALVGCWSPDADLAACVASGRCASADGGTAGGTGGGAGGATAGGSAGGGTGGSAGGATAGGSAGGGAGGGNAGGSAGGGALPATTCFLDGGWSWPCVQNELALSATAGHAAITPGITLLPAPDAGVPGHRWAGAVLTTRGEIACIPHDADRLLFIDPKDGGVRLASAPKGNGNWYAGAVVTAGGVIYAFPDTNQDVSMLRFDPVTGAGTQVALPTFGTLNNAHYCGGVMDAREHIWLIPHSAPAAVRFTPDAGLLLVDAGATDRKWCGGVLLANGSVAAMPQAHRSFLELKPDAGLETHFIAFSGAAAFSAVMTSTGTFYTVPQGYTNVLFADESLSAGESAPSQAAQYIGGALAPDGRLVFIPEAANPVLVTQTDFGNQQYLPTGVDAGQNWYGAATGPDGRIYACPYDSKFVLVIDPHSNRPLPMSALLSPWLNKL